MSIVIFLKKNKIKKKYFKKNIFLLKNVKLPEYYNNLKLNSLLFFYKNYFLKNKNTTNKQNITRQTILVNISQKIYNNKCTITKQNCLYTFSVGTVVKYFKVKQGKYVRRSFSGVRIFLNFLKNFFFKKVLNNNTKFNNFILGVSGFDYNSLLLKKNFKPLFAGGYIQSFFLLNLKINFGKKKDKKIKSIKKRLKKKIILNFINSNKNKK